MSQFIEMFGDPIKNSKNLPSLKGEELFVFSSGKANTKANLSKKFPYDCYGGNGITGKSEQWLIDFPTIIVGRVGEYCGCVHKTQGKIWITDNAIFIKEYKEKVFNGEFLFYLMTYLDFHRLADETGQPKITQRPLLSTEYMVPNLSLQEQFVSIAHQADKSGFDGLKSQFIEMFGTPENNHNDYPVIKIGEMVESINYGTSKPATDNGKYVYLRMNNITYDGKLDLSEVKRINLSPEEDDSAFVHKGDLMFNRTNTKEFVGKTTVFNLDEQMVVAGYIIRVRFKEKYSPEYVSGYLNSTYGKALLRKMAKGAVHQANINAQEFQGIQVLDVPKLEQDKYVTIAKQADKSGSVLQYRIAC